MKCLGGVVATAILFFALGASEIQAQCVTNEAQSLFASGGQTNDGFGNAVAMDGNLLAATATQESVTCGQSSCVPGSVYLFRANGGNWTEEIQLIGRNDQDSFGRDLAVDGDVVLVGAPKFDNDGNSNAGAAYVYRYDGEFWVEEAELLPSDPATEALFGWSVAMDGNTLAVGAPAYPGTGHPDGVGAVYMFEFDGQFWTETQKVVPEDGQADNNFGNAVALDGGNLLVGAPLDDDAGIQAGSVYAYSRGPTSWYYLQEFFAADAAIADQFGTDVAMDAGTAIVGSPLDDDTCPVGTSNCSSSGSAYLFLQVGGFWQAGQKLVASDGSRFNKFGSAVDIDGDIAVAFGENAQFAAKAYSFQNLQGSWYEVQLHKDSKGGDQSANPVIALSGDQIAFGYSNNFAIPGGYVNLYTVPPLAISIAPSVATIGTVMTLTTCGGFPGNGALFVITEINGVDMFFLISAPLGFFDSQGVWRLTGPITSIPGDPPNQVEFKITTLAIGATGGLVQSNEALLQLWE